MTDRGGMGLDGLYSLLAKLLDQHSEREQALVREALFGADAVPKRQHPEPAEATPLPRRRPGAASLNVVVRDQAVEPSCPQ
jgi:hypothetical protein